ncbi:MAG: 2-oxoglutarate and iron-dependent oxygenase domain-containing protein [Devosia sp.]
MGRAEERSDSPGSLSVRGAPGDYRKVARTLVKDGFAVLVDRELALQGDRVFAASHDFFEREHDAKLVHSTPARLEGYRPMGSEFSQSEDVPDLCEFFSVWHRNEADGQVGEWAADSALRSVAVSSLAGYAAAANGVLDALRRHLAPGGEAIDASRSSYVQVNHYRPHMFEREFLQEEHEDGHLLTFHRATRRGLEIRVGDRFVEPHVAAGDLLVLPGSLLTLVTGGLIAPLYHRVRNHFDATRQSLLYFVNPDVSVETAPWISNESNRGADIRAVALSCLGAR